MARLPIAASLLALATAAHAAPVDRVRAADLRRDIAVLAADDYAGRDAGTAGGERTEAWLVERFAAAGLTPGAPGGLWRQPVTFTPKGQTLPRTAANIIAMVPGASRPDEAVVLTAHWDHLGLCRPAGAVDRICNGAVDNASGVAMLVEIGRLLAAGPRPARSIYLVATTAEEKGLIGAKAFAANPPLPLDHIVAALNLDTAAITGRGEPVAIMGRGRTPTLDMVVDAEARHLGRAVDLDHDADVMLKRQDGWALGQAGVPAVMVSGAFSDFPKLVAYLKGNYHKPTDDMAHLPSLDGAAEDATLHIAVARALADPARFPTPPRLVREPDEKQ